MAIILGICNANDSGAAVIVDGKIVAAANEERFVREKLIQTFPEKAIEFVLEAAGATLADVDWIGCGAWRGIDEVETLPRLLDDVILQMETEDGETRSQIRDRLTVSAKNDRRHRESLLKSIAALDFPRDRVIFCDHHYSHAATAFYCSAFEEAYVYCADGRGDSRSVTLWKGSREKGLEIVDSASELNSPGAFYGIVTKHLGFTPDRHEGKVTGLAARGGPGKALDVLRSTFGFDPAAGSIRAKIGRGYSPFVSSSPPDLAKKLGDEKPEDVAYAAQMVLEETLCSFLMKHVGHLPPGSINLCLAGGCMSNVKLNYELGHLDPVKNTYVFPAMGDGGNALGGAIHVAVDHYGQTRFDLPTVFLGPSYGDQEISALLREQGRRFETHDGDAKIEKAASLLAEGKVLGWFQGGMEYGPRALGARSILSSAENRDINDSLNARLMRTEFMPFAPVTTNLLADRCLRNWAPDHAASRFMTICYDATDELEAQCPGVVHVDGTVRPQVVFAEDNPEYFALINRYEALTGRPALVNTSFNHHEEPIVMTPGDALRSFDRGNVDILVMGDHFLEYSNRSPS